jgi:DNA-binding response OmpR family regulator
MTTTPIRPRHERTALRGALESAGFLVFEASDDGRDRRRLREFWAALILLGLPVPRLGGLEVFRRLRGAHEETPEAIILTHGRHPEPTAAVRLGMVDVLARPLTHESVRAAVEEVLRPAAGSPPGPTRPRVLVAVEPLLLELLRAKQALDRREFDGAERRLRRALAMDPDSAVAHNLMGVLHQRLGEHRAAYRAFKVALRADPGYEPALENLRRHCTRFGLELPGPSDRVAD